MSVNFLIYKPGTRFPLPFKFINSDLSVDIKRGCILIRINKFVECVSQGWDIPKDIVIDLANACQNDVIRLSDIQLPPGLKPSTSVHSDFVIAKISSGKGA